MVRLYDRALETLMDFSSVARCIGLILVTSCQGTSNSNGPPTQAAHARDNNSTHVRPSRGEVPQRLKEEVTLTGTYTKAFLAKKNSTPHMGYYKLVVSDSFEVNLLPPYKKEAKRPLDEVNRLEGKLVSVTGIVVGETAFSEPSLEIQPQTVSTPCFIEIKSITLAP